MPNQFNKYCLSYILINVVCYTYRSAVLSARANAVSPPGIEGLKPTWDCKEVVPGVNGVGALAIGNLKLRVELNLVKKAIEAPSGYCSYKEAFETARELLLS